MDSAKLLPQIKAALVICMGAYSYGTALGWTSNITEDLVNGVLNKIYMNHNDVYQSASYLAMGALTSSLSIGFIADVKGRKYAALLTVVPFTLGWLVVITAPNISMLSFGRFLLGLAGGSYVVIAPLYVTEVGQNHIRGSLCVLVELFISLGVLHSNVLGWALPMIYFNLTCLFFPILFGVLLWNQPESPIYYLKAGRREDAIDSYIRLRGENYDFNVEIRYFDLEVQQLESVHHSKAFFKVLRTKSQLKATFICVMLLLFQQFSGRTVNIFYAGKIFVESNTPVAPHFAVMITGIVGVFGNALGSWLIDKIGRRVLLNISSSLCAMASFLLGLYFTIKVKLDEEDTRKVAYFLPLLGLFLFIFGYNLGLGPIPWLTSTELLTVLIRAKMMSFIAVLHWFFGYFITRFFFVVNIAYGIDHAYYWFMFMCMICLLFVYIFVPETRNRIYLDFLYELEDCFVL